MAAALETSEKVKLRRRCGGRIGQRWRNGRRFIGTRAISAAVASTIGRCEHAEHAAEVGCSRSGIALIERIVKVVSEIGEMCIWRHRDVKGHGKMVIERSGGDLVRRVEKSRNVLRVA